MGYVELIAVVIFALVAVYGITAWAKIRLQDSLTERQKVTFTMKQLKFAKRQHNDMAAMRSEHIKQLGGNHGKRGGGNFN